ncbi:MAG: hypothetical protein A2750_02545 [Candidatus Yanofskybacteria bacterium RIFCSPHIGHO2_01_FULL_45_42]|uniref:HTH psq-type domain-containing protein n=2 Tax=Candidatus Yanofskyibacteriota TaxID=1752733 RepID=A0A1F8F707_9BACT|nr:MAG: hypothetical protein A2750_02545 [Candidatus Yanofskybacteria bacterium RIFCSPHIGHO2_01_FULL_45_42]OGN16179.1 MAG: hypothetical protein A3C81_01080 [Candidatus Yanofskybacteria bacterium RIFCSPHIGHO2_02_FULL_46_19]OHB22868.1 MAG: hypothetical protein A3I22_00245 [Parcubacteria group bacterium RIFCSPLOWO2_02_FULL_40_12]
MRKDKIEAFALRRQGKSYSEISRTLNVPKSTLADWFSRENWSKVIRDRLGALESLAFPQKLAAIQKANKERWGAKYEEYRAMAIREFASLKNDPLFLAGIMLYWGEGEKQPRSSVVRMRNSEPEMIRLFYLFLTKILGINASRISAWLLLYPDLIDPVQKNFWSKATGISLEQFKKSTYIKGGHPTKRLSYGVCTIVINSRALKERVLKWLELYQDFLRSHALKMTTE